MEYSHVPSNIDKDLIPILEFDDRDVLTTEEGKLDRRSNLRKAMFTGNSDHNKVKIIFEDNLSLKQVETTIWGITENYVILKRNALIPIRSVHEVIFI